MALIDEVVQINITQQTAAIQQPSFSIPLIVGPNATSTLAYYTSAAGLLTAGFTTSDIEYVYATEMMEQALAPLTFGVGKRTTAVEQVDTFMVNTLTHPYAYTFTINGNVLSYTSGVSDTQQSILTALNVALAAISPVPPATGVVTGTGGSATLTITSATPGAGLTYTAVAADLTYANVTPNNGIQSDLNNIVNATNGNLWYGMCLASNQAYDILQTASFIEATGNRIYVAATNDSNVPTSLTTDVISQLQALSYKRTAAMYSPVSYNLGMDAGWLGGQLPQTPGSSIWAYKNIVGIAPDSFTSTQLINMTGVPGVGFGKNANVFVPIGGYPVAYPGIMVGGQFIDTTIFIDWLRVTMQTAVFAQQVALPKIPYTDKGFGVFENQVRSVLIQGSDAGGSGGIDATTIVVNAVPVASIPQNDRALRYVPTGSITFGCRLTGAAQNIVISGTVTV
jgi:hypothetical protein